MLNLNRRRFISKSLIRLAFLVLITCVLGKATPDHRADAYILPKKEVTHINKSQPPVEEVVKVEPAPAPQAENPAPTPEPVAPVLEGKDAWLNASVIASSDYGYVDYIVSHESGWNPNATEPTYGAHGLPQALPYSKTGCGWTDAVCQLNWANSYAVARYGSWASAYSYWTVHHNW
jgi:hypothetical protein